MDQTDIVKFGMLYVGLAFIVGLIGQHRPRMGFAGSFLLSLLFTPIAGLLATMLSKHISDIERDNQRNMLLSEIAGVEYREVDEKKFGDWTEKPKENNNTENKTV